MLECFVAGVGEHTLLATGSIWESCLDTSMFQTQVYRDLALNAVQVAAWGAADKMAENGSDRLGNPAAPAVVYNMTHEKKVWAHVLHVDSITVSGVMWLMMVAMSIAIISYICCSSGAASPPPLAGASGKGSAKGSTSRPGADPWRAQRRQPPTARLDSSGPAPLTPRGARGAQECKLALPLCEKDSDSCHNLGLGSGILSPMTATTAASSAASLAPRSRTLSTAASSAASVTPRGFLFTVMMEALSDVARKSTFSIKDTFSSMVLRGSVSRTSHGLRTVQLFLDEDSMTPCACVEPTPSGSQAIAGSWDLRGANNMHLGRLTLQSTGSFVVHAPGQPDLIIEGKEGDVDLHVFSRDGGLKATVACKEIYPSGPEQVEIHVLPGIDPVLIVTCTLAILFLCGER